VRVVTLRGRCVRCAQHADLPLHGNTTAAASSIRLPLRLEHRAQLTALWATRSASGCIDVALCPMDSPLCVGCAAESVVLGCDCLGSILVQGRMQVHAQMSAEPQPQAPPSPGCFHALQRSCQPQCRPPLLVSCQKGLEGFQLSWSSMALGPQAARRAGCLIPCTCLRTHGAHKMADAWLA
jgi:hypothetical protein